MSQSADPGGHDGADAEKQQQLKEGHGMTKYARLAAEDELIRLVISREPIELQHKHARRRQHKQRKQQPGNAEGAEAPVKLSKLLPRNVARSEEAARKGQSEF